MEPQTSETCASSIMNSNCTGFLRELGEVLPRPQVHPVYSTTHAQACTHARARAYGWTAASVRRASCHGILVS